VPATTRAAVRKIAFANRGKAKEVADEDLPHGESINRYIAAAKEELSSAENRCIWDYYAVHDKLLGRGGFARVFRSRCLATGDPVAIKVISRENDTFEMQEAGAWGPFPSFFDRRAGGAVCPKREGGGVAQRSLEVVLSARRRPPTDASFSFLPPTRAPPPQKKPP